MGQRWVARAGGFSVAISEQEVLSSADGASSEVGLRWLGAEGGQVLGEQPTGGRSNYYLTKDPALWRAGVPHYARVRVRDLYPGIDAVYYAAGAQLEFDLILGSQAAPAAIRFQMRGHRRLSLSREGDLLVKTDRGEYRFRRPRAYQEWDGVRRDVECRYAMYGASEVGFRLGEYDRTRETVIDPVVEYLSYLGGSGIDRIQALEVDALGNALLAGISNSPNFPGLAPGSPAGLAHFFARVNATGSALEYVTFVGANPRADLRYVWDEVSSLAVDAEGQLYAVGTTVGRDFPTSASAWERSSGGGYALKLDRAGRLVYSTYLGPSPWTLSARRIRVRDAVAYLAGTTSRAEFLGTPGALQRDLAGASDFFVAALAEDGSRPLFITAFGGAGRETLGDMLLDRDGQVVLVGASSSSDLPLTPDALPVAAGAPAGGAVLARIDATGRRLLFSTWLGSASVNGLTQTPDGDLVIAGASPPSPEFLSMAPQHTIRLPVDRPFGYVAKLSRDSFRLLWCTRMQVVASNSGAGIQSDSQGNLYWADFTLWPSGGAFSTATGVGLLKLSADGQSLLYSSTLGVNLPLARAAVHPTGMVWFASYTGASSLATTPGAIQPRRDPAPAGTEREPLNWDDGVLARFYLSSFADGNFFVDPQSPTVTWREGEPPPEPQRLSVVLMGVPATLETAPSSPMLTASFSGAPSSQVFLNVNPATAVAGTYQEYVTLRSPANPNSGINLPVTVKILPRPSFELSSSQVEIRVRQGQERQPAIVEITKRFGAEYFEFAVLSSDPTWLYASVNHIDATRARLDISAGDKPAGTYEGTLTLRLVGIRDLERVVRVRYIVDPPARLQVSSTLIPLRVIKNQPLPPYILKVSSEPSGARFSHFMGVSAVWLQVTQSGATTPGELRVMVDSAAAEVGYWAFNLLVRGEAGPEITVRIEVEVISGAVLDISPTEIRIYFQRGGNYSLSGRYVSFVGRESIRVEWSADQPWISPQQGVVTTPAAVLLGFNPYIVPEGIHKATLTARAGSVSQAIPITFEVYDTPRLVFSTEPISFRYRIGDPPPAPQRLSVTCPTLLPASFATRVADASGFLNVEPRMGATPATLTLTADVAGKSAGTYRASLLLELLPPRAPFYEAIPVTLEILPDPNAPAASISRVVSAASYLGGAVSPGEIVVLFGAGFGAEAIESARPGTDGRFPLALAGTRVLFDGVPAPILYVSARQMAVVAPFGLAGKTGTQVVVEAGGRPSQSVSLRVAEANPAVFTADSSGAGLAAALNVASDGSTSPHSPGNPVSHRGIVTLFATGLGATTPPSIDGAVGRPPLPQLNQPVRVLIGGRAAEVLYAGPAPGLINGLMQLNVRLAEGTPTGLAPLLVLAGDGVSQPGVTLAVN